MSTAKAVIRQGLPSQFIGPVHNNRNKRQSRRVTHVLEKVYIEGDPARCSEVAHVSAFGRQVAQQWASRSREGS